MKRIYFAVTNDLTYDQRMHRICGSLASAGYQVTLVGRRLESSLPIREKSFSQKRLKCLFNKGFAFYAEYNLRLLFYLLPKKMDAVCAVDLDTILPSLLVSLWKGLPRVYDAHEYFTELKEVRTRPVVKKFWTLIEKFAVPKFAHGYTVSKGLADAFEKQHHRNYSVIRNLPVLGKEIIKVEREAFLLYQGAVNEGRGFEWLIPAVRNIPYKLVICGDGNFMPQLKALLAKHGVHDRVELKGMMLPEDLRKIAAKAALGVCLAEKEGTNQFHALPNKFLEYMHAGLPQIAMNFPEYRRINKEHRVAVLLDEISIEAVATCINSTMANQALLRQLSENAERARVVLCWQNEEKTLLDFYQQLFL